MASVVSTASRKVLSNATSRVPLLTSVSSREKSSNEGKKRRDLINHSRVRGIDILRNPKLNKGTAFTVKERQLMGIHGLIPPVVRTMEEQTVRVLTNFQKRSSDLDRFIYLISLQDRNERLFYKVLSENVEAMMPIVYTPTVGQACEHYGVVFRRPRGLFISINDRGHIYDILCNWPERNVKAIVVTDGERILGLGDLGVYGMGIPVGKLSLYTALGGIHPAKCLPILLDVGTNNKKLHDDPLYIGRQKNRVTGAEYDDFIDEFMHAVQRTAAVAAAGVFASLRITGKKLIDNVFLFQGAGEANIGIAQLLSLAMQEQGATEAEAFSRIWMVDSRGLLTKGRPSGGISGHKEDFAKDFKHMNDLEEIVEELKPSAIIGAAAVAGAFTEKVIKSMAKHNERPIIFALSNPTSKAECSAEQAYTLTEGRCVFASGSPFPSFTINGKTLHPGQGNNAYIFPGVALGVITCGVRHVPDLLFLRAAQ
ncbi:malic enzyme, partial [Elysia marginata]